MLTAISRYGARVAPETDDILRRCERTGTLIEGPHIREFESAFARRLGQRDVVATSYGRMAFYYLLKALDVPPGSEIAIPALTFWVIPELARVAGLKPLFVDVDPETFTMDPRALERTITDKTRAVVPTHLYGLPCDMDAIEPIARRHDLRIIEDCAHALGATARGRPVGTLGDAALFSLQTLKPLNTFGGGVAVARDPAVLARVRALADSEPWPDQQRINRRLLVGRLQRLFIKPRVFTFTAFPILWAASWGHWNPDVYLWEPIRILDPLPDSYRERYPNVQAAVGLAGLKYLDDWTARTVRHARRLLDALARVPGVHVPEVPHDRTHVYYQCCAYVGDRDAFVLRAIRRGIDVETLHVDVCPDLDIFAEYKVPAPGAQHANQAVQLPAYAALSDRQVDMIVRRVARPVAGSPA
ncbi:MAG: aminotransferase class I/II-fold pyridoxal phosphate-dependent enzyme [Acidobacteria bacterium]|nr:aminotransferase class I/II-fold pyridoxal phosphate-dependent enzyme [Acidobacteriota bacterium]